MIAAYLLGVGRNPPVQDNRSMTMRKITRALAAATIAAAIGGGAIGIASGAAQAQPARKGAPQEAVQPVRAAYHGHGPGSAMGDPAEHLKRWKDDVGITDAQTAAWDAYAKVVTETAERMRAEHTDRPRHRFMEMSTAERLAELTKARATREDGHAKVKAAAEALLPGLTDTQKVRALMTLPGLASPHMMMRKHAMRHHHHGGPSSH